VESANCSIREASESDQLRAVIGEPAFNQITLPSQVAFEDVARTTAAIQAVIAAGTAL